MTILTESTGVIVLPPFHDLASGRIQLSFAEHDAKLLFFLTYFDRVAVMPFNMMGLPGIITSTELEQTLVSQKVIGHIFPNQIKQNGHWDEDLISGIALEVYDLVNSGGDMWGIAGPVGTVFPAGISDVNALVVTLANCLPIPLPLTPLADILAFKASHEGDLARLRRVINRLGLSFRAGVKDADVRQIVEDELLAAVGSVVEAHKKRGIPFFKADLSVSFALPKVVVAAAAEWIAGNLGAAPGIGAIVGSAISFNLGKSSFAREDNKHPKDFEYVLKGLRQGILAIEGAQPFENDIESRTFSNNIIQLSYPQLITPPQKRLQMPNMENNVM